MLLRHRELRCISGAALLLVASCSPPAERQVREAPPKPSRPQPTVLFEQELDREDIILRALHAITSAALGQDDRTAQAQLKGRKFAVRMRFGCPGLTNPARSLNYDGKEQVLRVSVQSDLTDQPLPASDLIRQKYEGAVGFILGQPWLLTAGCPSPAFVGMSGGQPTIILAQLFTAEESRAQRPGANYQLTKAVKPEQAPRHGLDLVVSGRLAELADGRPIHCAAADGAPACIVAAKIDRVAVVDPDSDEAIGEWSLGLGPAR